MYRKTWLTEFPRSDWYFKLPRSDCYSIDHAVESQHPPRQTTGEFFQVVNALPHGKFSTKASPPKATTPGNILKDLVSLSR